MKKSLEKAVINLLENSVEFINNVPNHKYKVRDFHCSYDLASEIDATLKLLKPSDDQLSSVSLQSHD